MRGIDVLGQGIMQGLPALAGSVTKQLEDRRRQEEIANIIGNLMAAQRGLPSKMGTDIGSAPAPGSPGVPMFSQQNLGALTRFGELTGGAGPNILKQLQPDSQIMQTFRGGLEQVTKQPYGDISLKTLRDPMPEQPRASSTSQKWYDVIGPDGKPEVGVVNGVKSKKQYTRAINPDTGQWEIQHQWVKYDQSAQGSGKPPRNQLVYTKDGFMAYDPYGNKWMPIQGADVKWKVAPTESRNMDVALSDNLNTISEIESIVNRGSITGPVTGRARQFGARYFSDPEAQTLSSRVAQLRTLIYGLSGKQINESEQEWLKNDILPSLENPSSTFEVKMNELKGWLTRRRGQLRDQFKELNSDSQSGGTTPPAGAVVRKYNPKTGKIE